MIDSKPTLQYETKTAASKLPIAVPDAIIKYIDSLPRSSDFIFPQKNGLPMNPNNFLRDFKLKVKQAIKLLQEEDPNYSGMDKMRFHDLETSEKFV